MYHKHLLGIAALTILSGCGGNNEQANTADTQKAATLPNFTGISVSTAPLEKVTNSQFTTHLKNGIFMRYHQPIDTRLEHNNQSDSVNASTSFSTTNQQEQDVHEADRVKYDGNYLYIAANSNNDLVPQIDNPQPHYIRILKRTESGMLESVKDLPTSHTEYSEQNLYLEQNTLVSINSQPGWFSIGGALTIEPLRTQTTSNESFIAQDIPQFEISFADITTPEQANISQQYTIDGALIDSRIIDGTLYIVSNFRPTYSNFDLSNSDTQTQLKNYQALAETDIRHLIPSITRTDTNQTQALFDTNDCYISQSASQVTGYDAIMSITRISLSNPTQHNTVCVNTEIEGIYASKNALYTYSTHYEEKNINSVIHKFKFDTQTFNYVASGTISGHFGQNLKNLRFSEYNDHLRVVTSSGDFLEGFQHKLHVLAQEGTELTSIAELPNQTNTTPIGKINSVSGVVDEDIYAVRFFNDLAYVVTFQQTDPLYVINLTTPAAPYIAGALEVPGYSAYLHPISESLLLGIGQEVEDINSTEPANLTQGAKVSLFDVSDITAPTQLSSKVFPDAYTPAEYNYRALSFLQTQPQLHKFSMPLEKWEQTGIDPKSYQWTKRNQLALFEINTETKALSHIGDSGIKYDAPNIYNLPLIHGNDDRAVLQDDHIYYVHGNYTWYSLWQTPSQNTGPL
ncbi:hypothetical protein PCIT_b0776 [Pseudoalteromonas citrea]|uniref:Beta-propeller domain-containing protein n=2 Tax=Pseudoalteromonas citrea TaxID=43655 RepID=A0AAD4AEZ2_9GAMM|nr:beta-propeller domain-containing protein [Pseudoalteromonas citrea]KAF7764724.1 hypothetical protein PCIT_b0776 [Pseudoalteromonas citrea]